MSVLTRMFEIISWKHWAWVCVIGVVWPSIWRIGSPGNTLDAFQVRVWLNDILWCVSFACAYLFAIIWAEAATTGPRGPSTRRYALAVLGAVATSAVMALHLLPLVLGDPTHPFGQREIADLASGRADKSGYLLAKWMRISTFAVLATSVYAWLRLSRAAQRALAEAEMARTEAQSRLLAARLDSAQEKVDADEVLERLESIEATYESDHARADAMMEDLIAYLKAAIPRLRSDAIDVQRK